MTDFLVADIGGTNARFALATTSDKDGGGLTITSEKIFKCVNFDGVGSVLEEYREFIGGVLPDLACIAIAGPCRWR